MKDEIIVDGITYVPKEAGEFTPRQQEVITDAMGILKENNYDDSVNPKLIRVDGKAYLRMRLPNANSEWTNAVFKTVVNITEELHRRCYVEHNIVDDYNDSHDDRYILIYIP